MNATKPFAVRLAAAAFAAALTASLFALPASSANDALTTAAADAAGWLAARTEADGGLSNGFAPGSDVGATADAVVALAAAGRPTDASLGFLAAQVRTNKKLTVGLIAKITLAVHAAGDDPKKFGGADLIARLLDLKATYIEIPVYPNERAAGATKAFKFRNICSVGHTLLEIWLRRLGKLVYPAAARRPLADLKVYRAGHVGSVMVKTITETGSPDPGPAS